MSHLAVARLDVKVTIKDRDCGGAEGKSGLFYSFFEMCRVDESNFVQDLRFAWSHGTVGKIYEELVPIDPLCPEKILTL